LLSSGRVVPLRLRTLRLRTLRRLGSMLALRSLRRLRPLRIALLLRTRILLGLSVLSGQGVLRSARTDRETILLVQQNEQHDACDEQNDTANNDQSLLKFFAGQIYAQSDVKVGEITDCAGKHRPCGGDADSTAEDSAENEDGKGDSRAYCAEGQRNGYRFQPENYQRVEEKCVDAVHFKYSLR